MTRVYLVRHAEAEGNLFRRIHGQYDSPVTLYGRKQIECLKVRFADISVDAVYSSDLLRTCQTAQAVYLPKSLPLHTDPRLREIHLGDWEDQPFGVAMRVDPEHILAFDRGDLSWMVHNGESLGQVLNRVYAALWDIIHAHPDQTVAVFSHGTALRLLLTFLTGADHYLQEGFNTAVSCLEGDENGIQVLWYNDATHLTPDSLNPASKPRQGTMAELMESLFWFRPWNHETEQDLYLAWRKEAWLSSHGTLNGFDANAFLSAALAHCSQQRSAVQVVMSGDTSVGMLELDFKKGADEGVGAIAFYYVDEKHRKHGHGVQLLGEAISVFRPLGRKVLRLRCAPENAVAYRFYTRNGFYKIGMAEDSLVPLYLMERPI